MDGNVLILDYSEPDRERIRYLLKLIGDFNVKVLPSINEYYLQMDYLNDFSLVIMDIAFPNEAEGFEILSALKKGSCKNVPVIIVTKAEKLEHRDKAAKMGVNDYIIKPYNLDRLESSIRSMVKVENKFYYGIKDIDNIVMSFERYIENQLYMADAIKQPLSILVITTLGINDDNLLGYASTIKKKESAMTTAVATIKPMLSITDIIAVNNNRDILVVLPLTDSSYVKLCREKVVENINAELEKIGEKYENYFYAVSVTYPDEGKDFQALMKNAFNKIADKDMYERASNISEDKKAYARKIYNKYSGWF